METDFALNHDCSNCGMHVVAGHLVRAGQPAQCGPSLYQILIILTGDSILAWGN